MITTNKNTKPVPLTKDMLYIPKKKDEADSVKSVVEEKQTAKDEDKEKEKEEAKYSNISKYPFIALNARIPFDVLRMKTRKEIIKSLFHESEFMKLMSAVVVEQHEKKHNEILHENALTILKLLFPTSFPFTNDITESMNHLLSGSVVNLGLFEQKQISYIKIDGKVQTISKVVWLNDIMNHPLYYDFMKTMNKYVEWANKNKDNIEYGGKKVLNKITGSIFDAYNNANYNDISFNESINIFRREQESNIKYLYTRDEKRYTEANKNFQVFNLFVNNIHKIIIDKRQKKVSVDKIKEFISESLVKFSDLNRVYAVDSRHLPDILKKIFKHIKDYSESKFYTFRRNIFDSQFNPILTLSSPDLSSKNSDFKIYDETREKFKKFCSPTLKLKGGLVSMDDVSQEGDIKNIQKIIDNFVGITDGEIDETKRDTINFYNLLREFIAQETKPEITISDVLRSFRLGVNAQNFGKDSLPGFQIYVRLDLLDGELNDKNISQIKCKFEDLSLTGKFNKMFYNKPYIWKPDMNPYLKIEEPKQQQQPKKAAAKVGGRKTRKKKYYKRRRSTHTKQRRFTFY
jgi:hypothetical protein